MGPHGRHRGIRALLRACCAVPSVHGSHDGDSQSNAAQIALHKPGQEQQHAAALAKQAHLQQDLKGSHSHNLRWHHTNRDPEDSPFELHGNGDSGDTPSGNSNTIGLPSPANSGGTHSGIANSGGGASGSSSGLRHYSSGGSGQQGGVTGGLGRNGSSAADGGKRQRQNSTSTSGAACSDAGGDSLVLEQEPRGAVRRVFSRGSDISISAMSASSAATAAAAAAAAVAAGAAADGMSAAALASSSAVFDIMLDAAGGAGVLPGVTDGMTDGGCSGSGILQPAASAPLERQRGLGRSISLLAPRSKSALSVASLTPPPLPRPGSSSHISGGSSRQQQQLPWLHRSSGSVRNSAGGGGSSGQHGSSISGSNRPSGGGSSGEGGRSGRVPRTESAFSISSSRSSSSTALLAAAAIRGNASTASITSMEVEEGAAAAGPTEVAAATGTGATAAADAPACTGTDASAAPCGKDVTTTFARAFLSALAAGNADWASCQAIDTLLDAKVRMVAVDGSVHDGKTAVMRRLNQGVAQLVKMLGDSADARAAASALAARPPVLDIQCPRRDRPGRLCATYTFRLGVRKFVMRDEVVVGKDGRIKRLRRMRS